MGHTCGKFYEFQLSQAVNLCIKFHKIHAKGPLLLLETSYNKCLHLLLKPLTDEAQERQAFKIQAAGLLFESLSCSGSVSPESRAGGTLK